MTMTSTSTRKTKVAPFIDGFWFGKIGITITITITIKSENTHLLTEMHLMPRF